MTNEATSSVVAEVACPFCGLACDDLSVDTGGDALAVVAGGCPKAQAGFARMGVAHAGAGARIAGKAVSFEEAYAEVARRVKTSALPVFSGMALDVNGMRGVMDLADAAGGVVDHLYSEIGWRSTRVVQDIGYVTTTLAEVKNRADLIVLVGTDVVTKSSRFFERYVWNDEAMFEPAPSARRIVYLGGDLNTAPGRSPDGREPEVFDFDCSRMPEALSTLNALLAKQPVRDAAPLGIEIARWQALADALRAAKYSVLVWMAGDFQPSQVDLNINAIMAVVRTLNVSTRCNGLGLGGADGELNASMVHAWQTGYPMRTSFASGIPLYDPVHNGSARLIAEGETDTVVWVSALNDTKQPPAEACVVIAPPTLKLEREPEVFIPVSTPGVHHVGHFFRGDKGATLPLRALRATGLPSAATVAAAITAKLKEVSA
ncbi:hypothetical protein [Methyloversatilis thermotolerans]|uniref:hypothetical protein n=1 Tax=Methyloversatilis thermotolerans TaxID=1346290 RepID=UPI00037BCCD1|nr:hypothetical protein [Methyloversatilis thermotolerans]